MKDITYSIHRKVSRFFHHQSTDKYLIVHEDWISHTAAVDAEEKFYDDCSGFALTCAEFLLLQGFPRGDVSIIFCLTENGDPHLVCGVSYMGVTYILDNRFSAPYIENEEYSWKYHMKFDQKGIWYAIQS